MLKNYSKLTTNQIRFYYQQTLRESIKRIRGEEASCLCPFHADTNPSLSVNLTSGLFHCHAGCGGGDVVAFESKLRGGNRREATSRISKLLGVKDTRTVKRLYQYPTYRQVIVEHYSCAPACGCERNDKRHRIGRKPFWQRKVEAGTYVNGLVGVERVPYRLNDLIRGKGEDVCAVESLEDVNTLVDHGFRALSMKDPWPKDWFEKYFAGEKVKLTILPDKDPEGTKQAHSFAAKAQQTPIFEDICSAEPPAPWPEHFDATKASRILGWGHAEFQQLLDSAKKLNSMANVSPCAGVSEENEASTGNRTGSHADALVELVESTDMELFHDQFLDPWACVPKGQSRENYRIRGKYFKQALSRLYWNTYRRTPSSEALRAALNVLEAKAVHDGKRHDLHVRVAWHDDALYYDLNPHAVRVNAEGWTIVKDPPILFRRYAGQQAQPEPKKGGRLTEVLEFVNLPGVDLQGQRLLFCVHLVVFFVPDIPRAILEVLGTKGSGKSTLSRVVQRILDPNEKDVLAFPDSQREFIQTLAHHHLPVFDNLGRLPKWASNALCRAVTGAGFSKRELYTDDDDFLYAYKRAIVLTSISSVATNSDLFDRCVSYHLPILDEHLQERTLWKRFESRLPLLLGAAFDTLSVAMRFEPEAESAPPNVRMADFAAWGIAVAKALGAKPAEFLSALDENSRFVRREAINTSPVGICVLKFLENWPAGWEGSSTELLAELKQIAFSAGVEEKSLPRDPGWLSREIKEIATDLEVYAWKVEFRHSGDRSVTFTPFEGARNDVHDVHEAPSGVNIDGATAFSADPCDKQLNLDGMDAMDAISGPSDDDDEVIGEELV